MADTFRTFSRSRGIRTTSTQTTGRTRSLGMPNNGTVAVSVPRAGVSVPTNQLNPRTSQGPSRITETARTKDHGSAV